MVYKIQHVRMNLKRNKGIEYINIIYQGLINGCFRFVCLLNFKFKNV